MLQTLRTATLTTQIAIGKTRTMQELVQLLQAGFLLVICIPLVFFDDRHQSFSADCTTMSIWLLHVMILMFPAVKRQIAHKQRQQQQMDYMTMGSMTAVRAARQLTCYTVIAIRQLFKWFCRPSPVRLALSFVSIGLT